MWSRRSPDVQPSLLPCVRFNHPRRFLPAVLLWFSASSHVHTWSHRTRLFQARALVQLGVLGGDSRMGGVLCLDREGASDLHDPLVSLCPVPGWGPVLSPLSTSCLTYERTGLLSTETGPVSRQRPLLCSLLVYSPGLWCVPAPGRSHVHTAACLTHHGPAAPSRKPQSSSHAARASGQGAGVFRLDVSGAPSSPTSFFL